LIKSFHGFTSFVLGIGLVASNFYTLNLLARKDSGIPDIAKLSSTPYSSIQIRSNVGADGAEEWTFASKQHDPKLKTLIIDDEKPTFNGGVKKKYTHKQEVAQFAIYPQGEGGKLTAKQISCIEKRAQGKSNGMMIADVGSASVSPTITGIPIIGPVLAGIFFGQARKQAGNVASDIAADWNDC
tara:strand:- start:528 stop:1079 length:552 start_codon:yes stop_codon:yes gene_type:complete